MGNKQSSFTEEQLEAFQDCTFFTRKEILRLHGRYRELAPHLVPLDYTNNPDATVPLSLITMMPELKENPFRERIVETFSEDGLGNLTFDDFVDMFSALSETSPRELKTIYAFKIYGGRDRQAGSASWRELRPHKDEEWLKKPRENLRDGNVKARGDMKDQVDTLVATEPRESRAALTFHQTHGDSVRGRSHTETASGGGATRRQRQGAEPHGDSRAEPHGDSVRGRSHTETLSGGGATQRHCQGAEPHGA